MASIQQSFNQILYSAGRLAGLQKLAKEVTSQRVSTEQIASRLEAEREDRMIKEAQEQQAVADKEAEKLGFADAQAQHEVQTAAKQVAENLKAKDPNFGFYTYRQKNRSAFGEGDPDERFNWGQVLSESEPRSIKSIQSYAKRMRQLEENEKMLKERISKLNGGEEDGE